MFNKKRRMLKQTISLLLTIFLILTYCGSVFAVSTSERSIQILSDRLAGQSRYDTSAEIAKSGWTNSDYAIIASGENFPDALCGAPLAKKYNAPILLTAKSNLDEQTKAQLARLKVKNVFIIGGIGIISSNVENEIISMGIQVSRIAGYDRYETSLKVAQSMGNFTQAVITTGANFPDALSIAPIAAMKGIPILLTPKDNLPNGLKEYLDNNVQSTYVVGGTGVVSINVFNQLPSPKRLSGTTRYDTNVSIIKEFINDLNFENCYIATGENFPDALAGSALASLTKSPVILVSNPIDQTTKDMISNKRSNIKKITAFGGIAVVPQSNLIGISTGDYSPMKIPVILLHGRSDNSETCWGATNTINLEVNGNEYDVDNIKSRVKSQYYTDVLNQSINKIVEEKDDLVLANELKNLGYRENVDLFVFNYPNVDFVQKNAILLREYINNLKSKYGYEKFDLVGHSMGGLVSRYYIENLYEDSNIRKLITIDTPHWGTYSAYFSYLNPTDGNGTKKLPCDVDLQNNSKMFGGEYQYMMFTLDDREKYINAKTTLMNGEEISLNQTPKLNFNRDVIKTKYYFIASVNYWNENIKLKNDSPTIVELQGKDVSINNVNTALEQWDKDNNEATNINNYLLTLINDPSTNSLGDDVVNLKSQLGLSNDGKIINTEKVSIYIEPVSDLIINHSLLDYLHSKAQHKKVVINKTIEYLNSNGSVSEPSETSNNTNIVGNSMGNIANNGMAAIQGDWIYYTNENDGHKIYKIEANGSNKTKINDDYSGWINVVGDWVYYRNGSDGLGNIYKIKTDGSSRTKINDDECQSINVIGDWIYYVRFNDDVNQNKIYKIKTDGSGKIKLGDDQTWNINVVGDWIYYVSSYADGLKPDENGNIYRIKTDGSNKMKLCDENTDIYDINVVDDWIYYVNLDEDVHQAAIYKIKTDGSHKTKLIDGEGGINVVGDWIYFERSSTGAGIYKIKTDGSNITKIYDDNYHSINVVGDWIYYSKEFFDTNMYKMNTDGSHRMKLE